MDKKLNQFSAKKEKNIQMSTEYFSNFRQQRQMDQKKIDQVKQQQKLKISIHNNEFSNLENVVESPQRNRVMSTQQIKKKFIKNSPLLVKQKSISFVENYIQKQNDNSPQKIQNNISPLRKSNDQSLKNILKMNQLVESKNSVRQYENLDKDSKFINSPLKKKSFEKNYDEDQKHQVHKENQQQTNNKISIQQQDSIKLISKQNQKFAPVQTINLYQYMIDNQILEDNSQDLNQKTDQNKHSISQKQQQNVFNLKYNNENNKNNEKNYTDQDLINMSDSKPFQSKNRFGFQTFIENNDKIYDEKRFSQSPQRNNDFSKQYQSVSYHQNYIPDSKIKTKQIVIEQPQNKFSKHFRQLSREGYESNPNKIQQMKENNMKQLQEFDSQNFQESINNHKSVEKNYESNKYYSQNYDISKNYSSMQQNYKPMEQNYSSVNHQKYNDQNYNSNDLYFKKYQTFDINSIYQSVSSKKMQTERVKSSEQNYFSNEFQKFQVKEFKINDTDQKQYQSNQIRHQIQKDDEVIYSKPESNKLTINTNDYDKKNLESHEKNIQQSQIKIGQNFTSYDLINNKSKQLYHQPSQSMASQKYNDCLNIPKDNNYFSHQQNDYNQKFAQMYSSIQKHSN